MTVNVNPHERFYSRCSCWLFESICENVSDSVSQSCPNATIVLCFVRNLQRQGNPCFRGPYVLYFIIIWKSLNWKEGKEITLCALCVVHVLWVNEA